MNTVITLVFVLTISFSFIYIGRLVKIPKVVSLILAGLFMNVTALRNYFIEPNTGFLYNLGDLAVLFLMFFTGVGSSLSFLKKEERDCLFIGLFASIATLVLGFGVAFLFGFSFLASCIAGISLSITDEGTTAKYLMDIKKLKTRLGSIMVGSGIVDDFIGLGLFIAITFGLKENYFRDDLFIILALVAFFAGLFLQSRLRKNWFSYFENFAMHCIIPFFFISIAFYFNFSSLVFSILALIALLLTAVVGKILGTLLTKELNNLTFDKLYLIGWGMNSRGALGMVIALIAFKKNLIPVELYSSLVLITLMTTLIFPLAASWMIHRNQRIMD